MQKNQHNGDNDNPQHVYAIQNPAYLPEPPSYTTNYMPNPPPYSEQSPPQAGAAAYSTCPPPDQPPYGFRGEDGPKPDVEVPPEYTAGVQDSNEFSERSIRIAFIRKVYATLTVQLIITFGLVFMFTFWQTLRRWTWQNPYLLFALIPAIFIMVMVLACCDQARRKVPLNFILLGIFTVFEGCLLGSFAAFFDADAVMWATGATILITFGLTIFAFQTKWDFTVLSGSLMVLFLVFLSFGILGAIFRSMWLNIFYACIGTFIFGIYLVVDTQLLIGGKHRYSVNPEEYIFAALSIYVDIINLFMLLLQIFGLCR